MLAINLNSRIINAEPQTASDYFPATKQAFRLGVLDARLGDLCVPAMYFRHSDDMKAYAMGYESVAGPTLLSRQILGKVAQ